MKTTTRRTPMLTIDGAPYHLFSEEVYVVALDEVGNEVSDRHAGRLYLAVDGPGSNSFTSLFDADTAGKLGHMLNLFVTTEPVGTVTAVMVADQVAFRHLIGRVHAHTGDWLDLDMSSSYDKMA